MISSRSDSDRSRFLEALEADDYAALPSGTQARGFLLASLPLAIQGLLLQAG